MPDERPAWGHRDAELDGGQTATATETASTYTEAAATVRVEEPAANRVRKMDEPLPRPITLSRDGARVLVTTPDRCERLGQKQGLVLWRLVEASQNHRSPWVHGQHLLEHAGSGAMHISQLFRSPTKRPLRQLIVSDRGVHRILRGRFLDPDTYEIADEPGDAVEG